MGNGIHEKLLKANKYYQKAAVLRVVYQIFNCLRFYGMSVGLVTGITTAIAASKGNLEQAKIAKDATMIAVGSGVAIAGTFVAEVTDIYAKEYKKDADKLMDEIKNDISEIGEAKDVFGYDEDTLQ